ncbi:MAG: peptidase [Acidiferrobacteraceae bacterium]|nr:peptidase [Acidiferrobacteraceae bacterium]|tara:strand:- start:191 stop:499 length:309 start_codon:yes stop_codon:yes gene_type:complete
MSACAGSEPFALQVIGNSMMPEFPDGCIVIIEPDGVIKDGSYVVADTDEEVLLRRARTDGNKWWLEALEPGHPDIPSPGPTSMRGLVIQRAGRRRKDRKYYL